MHNGNRILSVAGKFHYLNYARKLIESGDLDLFLYSGKVVGTTEPGVINLPVKEYLVRLHMKLLGSHLSSRLFPVYHDIWQHQISKRIGDASLWHFLLHGTNLQALREFRNRSKSSLSIGEAVNTHPSFSLHVMNEERLSRGLPLQDLDPQHQRLISESLLIDFLLAPTKFVADTFVQQGFPPERVFVLPFGINLDRFGSGVNRKIRNSRHHGKKIRIGCVAQLCLRKGQLYLIEAIKKLADPLLELILVGKYTDESKDIFLQSANSFTHIESLPHSDIPSFLRSLDIFVLPTLEEGLALALCEAIATGVPVVTTEASGVREISQDSDDITVLETPTVDGLCHAISDILSRDSSPNLTPSLIDTDPLLSEYIHRRSWDYYADEISKIYSKAEAMGRRAEVPYCKD